jgi:hypothetical protein
MWTLGRHRARQDGGHRQRLKDLAARALGDDPAIGVAVNEIVCADPACPGTETVILVMVPGRRTAACKVGKPMADVTDDDLRDALRDLAYADQP